MTRTKPCPYCGHKLVLHEFSYYCNSKGVSFRWDGARFRRVRA